MFTAFETKRSALWEKTILSRCVCECECVCARMYVYTIHHIYIYIYIYVLKYIIDVL